MVLMDNLLERRLTGAIISSFYRVYDELGFGFLESVYVAAMLLELNARGLHAEREAKILVYYRGLEVGHFRADLLVERKVIVEVKASLLVTEADRKQVLNYLRGTSLELGLLLHFGQKPSFQRFIYTNKTR
jgi:GxxExxY protein